VSNRRRAAALTVAATVGALVGMLSGAPAAKKAPARYVVLNGEGNNLNAFASKPPFTKQAVITNRKPDPKGLDINAQLCFFPDGKRFIAGEDTGQPDPIQGWGIFKMSGSKVGKLRATEIGKLQPTYQGATDNAENYGCGILPDGRVLTTDIGNQAAGPIDGQLIVWFPPLTAGFRTVAKGTVGRVRYCKIDISIGTAGGIAVVNDNTVYVTSARGDTTGVWRYQGPFPTSDDAAGGCSKRDSTGAPMADTLTKELFIRAGEHQLSTPNAIAPTGFGGWYVSSVINGFINEYDANGEFVRTVLSPPAGESLGEKSFSTGTTLGIGVGPDGTLYYADIGIVINSQGIGPGSEGTVRRIRFVDGEPQPPELMGRGLAFPDGIGIYVLRRK